MAVPFNHRTRDLVWRKKWEEHPVNVNDGKKPKYYCLDMFPLSVRQRTSCGTLERLCDQRCVEPLQADAGPLYYSPPWAGTLSAFRLRTTPSRWASIRLYPRRRISKTSKKQINDIAALYDWDMEVNTTDPKFYKWTQWIFVQMFKKGLAYEKEFPINWCPSCKTGLANEEVVNGVCERCGTPVTKKNLRQWMLKITAYADRLLKRSGQAGLAGEGQEDADRLDRQSPTARRWISR